MRTIEDRHRQHDLVEVRRQRIDVARERSFGLPRGCRPPPARTACDTGCRASRRAACSARAAGRRARSSTRRSRRRQSAASRTRALRAPSRARSAASSTSLTMAAASCAASPGSTSRPLTLSLTTSGMPATREATTGSSAPIASTSDSGRPSHSDGIRNMSTALRMLPRSRRAPAKCTRAAKPSCSTRRSSSARSSPSPTTMKMKSGELRTRRHRVEQHAVRLLLRQARDDRRRRRRRRARRASARNVSRFIVVCELRPVDRVVDDDRLCRDRRRSDRCRNRAPIQPRQSRRRSAASASLPPRDAAAACARRC